MLRYVQVSIVVQGVQKESVRFFETDVPFGCVLPNKVLASSEYESSGGAVKVVKA